MNLKITIGQNHEAELILVCKNQELIGLEKVLNQLKDKGLFKGDEEELFSHIDMESNKIRIFLGLGEEEKVDEEILRLAAFKGAKEISKMKVKVASAILPEFKGLDYRKSTKAFAEGLYHAEYRFDKYLSKKQEFNLEEVSLILLDGKEDKVLSELKEIENIMQGIFLTRNLINEPSITLTPVALAEKAKEELEAVGVVVTILDRAECEKLGMTAFLSVAKGSTNEPQGIIMRYKGGKDEAPIGLVGKGVTFDTGGYSLKPGPSMMTMNGDMGGSGAVIGAMKAIALNKVERNVTAVVLATDNMISADAYVPGDIIGSMAGKTIEVHSTDAEGRLTLADAVYYIIKHEGVTEVVDVATLTGACVVALGEFNTGAFTNNKELYGKVEKAAMEAGEPMWQLPLSKGYRDMIKGDRGDLKNTGGRWGGASTAAAFIEAFVEETPWVHLDIAGTSDIESARGYLPKGATGMPVKTLYYYVKGEKK